MRLPNALAILLSCLLLSVNVAADFDDGMVAYEEGDYETGLREFQSLAEQGDAAAQTNLGYMYARGKVVLQDNKEAVKWYTKAAEQGHALAQYNLALMYDNGEGVPQDNVYAHMWFNIASSNGSENARANRDRAAKRMTPNQLAEGQSLARECVKKDYKNC